MDVDRIAPGLDVKALAAQPAPDQVRFDFALTGVASYAVYQEGTNLYVTFDNPTDPFPTYVAIPGARGGTGSSPGYRDR